MEKRSKTFVAFAVSVFTCVGINISMYSVANAVQVNLDTGETIELDDGVVNVCKTEGLNLGACACVVSIMLEEEGLKSMRVT